MHLLAELINRTKEKQKYWAVRVYHLSRFYEMLHSASQSHQQMAIGGSDV